MPAEVSAVSQMAKADESLVFVDSYSQTLWLVPPVGEPRVVYNRKGDGPGEFKRLFNVEYSHGQWILADLPGRNFIFLDERFKLIKEIKVLNRSCQWVPMVLTDTCQYFLAGYRALL